MSRPARPRPRSGLESRDPPSGRGRTVRGRGQAGEPLVELGDVEPEQYGDARQELLRVRGRAVLDLLDRRLRDADLLAQMILTTSPWLRALVGIVSHGSIAAYQASNITLSI